MILSFPIKLPTQETLQTLRRGIKEELRREEEIRQEIRRVGALIHQRNWNARVEADEQGMVVKLTDGEVLSKATYEELAEKMILDGKFAATVYRQNAAEKRKIG